MNIQQIVDMAVSAKELIPREKVIKAIDAFLLENGDTFEVTQELWDALDAELPERKEYDYDSREGILSHNISRFFKAIKMSGDGDAISYTLLEVANPHPVGGDE
ncbi:MAG: hypothetical protein WCS28_10535 [Thiomicrospira sp.]